MEKRQEFIDAMSIYIDPKADDFYWNGITGPYQNSQFRIKSNKVSWRGEIRIPSVYGVKWRKITGSYYVKSDSIFKAVQFYRKYK